MSLSSKAASGIFWTFSQQFGIQIITFSTSIVLARERYRLTQHSRQNG